MHNDDYPSGNAERFVPDPDDFTFHVRSVAISLLIGERCHWPPAGRPDEQIDDASALAAGEPGGEHHAVIGHGGGRNTSGCTGFATLRQDDGSGGTAMRGDREGAVGVVVEPVEYLHMSGVGQPPMSEVGLPEFVGLLGGEPDVGGFGPLLRVGVISPAACRCRWIDAGDTTSP